PAGHHRAELDADEDQIIRVDLAAVIVVSATVFAGKVVAGRILRQPDVFFVHYAIAVDIAEEETNLQRCILRGAAVADNIADLQADNLPVGHPAQWDDDLLTRKRWSPRDPRSAGSDGDFSAGDVFGVGENDARAGRGI